MDSTTFQSYVAQVGSLYEALRRAKETSEQDENQFFRKGKTSPKPEEFEFLLNDQWQRRRYSGASDLVSPTSPGASGPTRKPGGQRARGAIISPLSTIPNVYFDENFRLENPRTFDIVSERSEVLTSPVKPAETERPNGTVEVRQPNRKALATNAILQEKLSWYLDTVEIHLISSISTASTSFFTALGSLRELHAEAEASVNKIQLLRNDLKRLDNDMALGGLNIINLRRRQENVRKLASAIGQLGYVIESVSRCEEMVGQGDIENAMDELDDVERLMAGESPVKPKQSTEVLAEKLIDLRRIRALEGASEDLAQLRSRIGVGYERRFLDCLVQDLRHHVDSVPPDNTLMRLGETFHRSRRGNRGVSSGVPAYSNIDTQLRSKLEIELNGLSRTRYTTIAATSFKNAVLREMKSMVRKSLPSSTDDDNESIVSSSTYGGRQLNQQEKSTILARNLRSMDPDDAHSMLAKIYTTVSEYLRRLSVQVKVLLDITSGLGSSPNPADVRSPTRSPVPGQGGDTLGVQQEILQVLDMSSLLGQAVDIIQSQIVKILKVRSEQASNVPLEHFLRYFSLNRLFADECEAISGRSGTALKTVVDTQIRDFINNFGDTQKRRLVQTMDSDRWDAKDFNDEESTTLSRVLDAGTKDIDAWTAAAKIWQTNEDETGERSAPTENGSTENTSSPPAAGKDKVRSAVVDDQKYILPESALVVLKVIEEFQRLVAGIPGMSQEIAFHLLECLKMFNSRSSQLILGAGATRSAGLKNITTKHLALASQALSFITSLVPYVREFIRRHSASGSLMAEFDKVKRLYQEHQSGINEKLVDIMSSRATIHVASMKKVNWDAEPDPKAVSSYVQVLTKETGTLHRVLCKHLPDSTVMMIMGPVFTSYRDQWANAFQAVTLKSEKGRQRYVLIYFRYVKRR